MKNKKILVVDDNAVILKSLTMRLESSGYEVVTAEDGGGAVGAVRRERPDLILLDINFPPDVAHGGGVPWDGFRIMDWLQRLCQPHKTPIIVISGSDDTKFKDRALAAGALSYFEKPIDSHRLMALIRQTLEEETAPDKALA
jgi:CheY-like chemotaxis protein